MKTEKAAEREMLNRAYDFLISKCCSVRFPMTDASFCETRTTVVARKTAAADLFQQFGQNFFSVRFFLLHIHHRAFQLKTLELLSGCSAAVQPNGVVNLMDDYQSWRQHMFTSSVFDPCYFKLSSCLFFLQDSGSSVINDRLISCGHYTNDVNRG